MAFIVKRDLPPQITYIYLATTTGMGSLPNMNGLRFYDTGLTQNGQSIYYDETNVYWLTYVAGFWIVAPIGTVGESGLFVKFSGINPVGDYSGVAGGYIGSFTLSQI